MSMIGFVALVGLTLISTPAAKEKSPPVCLPAKAVTQVLINDLHQIPQFAAMAGDNKHVFVMYANPDGSDWTLFVEFSSPTHEKGKPVLMMCELAEGGHWGMAAKKPQGEPD